MNLGTAPQAVSDLQLGSVDLGTDVYGEDHLQLPPRRQTRSGRSYCSILKITAYACPTLDDACPDAQVANPDTVLETGIDNRDRDILGLTCPTSLATVGNDLQLDPTQIDSLAPGQDPPVATTLVSSQSQSKLHRKSISFDTKRDVRLFSINSKVSEHKDYTQVCDEVEKFISQFEPQVYLMVSCVGLDHSIKEIFYKTTFTNPLANPIALELESDDFYY